MALRGALGFCDWSVVPSGTLRGASARDPAQTLVGTLRPVPRSAGCCRRAGHLAGRARLAACVNCRRLQCETDVERSDANTNCGGPDQFARSLSHGLAARRRGSVGFSALQGHQGV